MKRKLIIIFLAVIFGAVCSIIASYYTASNMSHAQNISLANSTLYNLNYVVDALNELKKSKSEDPIILEKLETILITSLVTLGYIKPDLETLQGTPINTLCRILKYNRDFEIAKNGIGKYQNKELPGMAISYLKTIEPELLELSENSIIPFLACNDLFGIKKKYRILK